MYRVIIALIIFIIASYIGFYYGESFKKRCLDLKECYKALLMLNNQIIYNNTPIIQSFTNIKHVLRYPYDKVLEEVICILNAEKADNIFEAFLKSSIIYEGDIYLKDEDKKIIKDLACQIGTTETYGQEKIINLALENIKVNIKEAEELSKNNCKMYRYLGVCFGLMLAILII